MKEPRGSLFGWSKVSKGMALDGGVLEATVRTLAFPVSKWGASGGLGAKKCLDLSFTRSPWLQW